MFEIIKERYLKGYVTEVQLERYVNLGVLTNQQLEAIKIAKQKA